jgi:hypothetical protein
VQRAEADLDRKLGAVVAASVELEVGAHLARPRIGHVPRAVREVDAAEALGDEELDGAAEQLAAVVAEELLGAPVDKADATLGVGEHDRVGCRIEQGFEPTHV